MLSFLYFAARKGFVVESYVDDAVGVMSKNSNGKQFISLITLHPAITFEGGRNPSAEELQALHHTAHSECYIANSLRCDVVVHGD